MDFKYGGKPYIGRKLAEAMYDRILCEDISFNITVPVPIHKERKDGRGYNQAEIIAVHMSRKLKIKCEKHLLKRTVNTEAMKNLSIAQRRDNIRGAFEIPGYMQNIVRHKKVLLVDDIYTTGATFDECTQALKKAGAEEVYCIAFASGANRKYESD